MRTITIFKFNNKFFLSNLKTPIEPQVLMMIQWIINPKKHTSSTEVHKQPQNKSLNLNIESLQMV